MVKKEVRKEKPKEVKKLKNLLPKKTILNIHPVLKTPNTFGQKAADKLTKGAGSWTFIAIFVIILILWIIFNTAWLIFGTSWDQKPFIMLNLMLSCIAALQAPIILMSQNRSNQKDRIRAEYDYAVNRKAAREIENIKRQLNRIENRFLLKKK